MTQRSIQNGLRTTSAEYCPIPEDFIPSQVVRQPSANPQSANDLSQHRKPNEPQILSHKKIKTFFPEAIFQQEGFPQKIKCGTPL
jgi:hypothetical protein